MRSAGQQETYCEREEAMSTSPFKSRQDYPVGDDGTENHVSNDGEIGSTVNDSLAKLLKIEQVFDKGKPQSRDRCKNNIVEGFSKKAGKPQDQ